jgi:hypothetical protein
MRDTLFSLSYFKYEVEDWGVKKKEFFNLLEESSQERDEMNFYSSSRRSKNKICLERFSNLIFDQLKKFANEFTLLGFTGVGTDASDFDHLNEGWVYLAENNANTKKATYDGTTPDDYVTRLQKLLDVVDDDVLDSVTILMSPRDYESYVKELGTGNKAVNVLLNANAKSYLGHPILPVRYFPAGKYMATPMENLVFGICSQVSRDRQYNARKRVVEYTFDIAVDYEIAVDKYCAICTPA